MSDRTAMRQDVWSAINDWARSYKSGVTPLNPPGNEYHRWEQECLTMSARIDTALDALIADERARADALAAALRDAADELHERGCEPNGSEDYTDCPEEGCVARCAALGWENVPAAHDDAARGDGGEG